MLTHLAAAAALLVALAPVQDDDALKKLEGTWTVTKLVNPDGQAAPDEALSKMKIVIKGDTMTFEGPKPEGDTESHSAKIKLDAKDSKAMDVTAQDGPQKDMTMAGIYKLEGDELTMCFPRDPGDPRPKDFDAGKEAKNGMIVLKKMK